MKCLESPSGTTTIVAGREEDCATKMEHTQAQKIHSVASHRMLKLTIAAGVARRRDPSLLLSSQLCVLFLLVVACECFFSVDCLGAPGCWCLGLTGGQRWSPKGAQACVGKNLARWGAKSGGSGGCWSCCGHLSKPPRSGCSR